MVTSSFEPDENGIPSLTLSDWEEAKKALNELESNWIFRGQSDAGWPLATSLERTVKDHPMLRMREWEEEFVQQFQRAAHHYLRPGEVPNDADRLEWLALMQHHGAPTRLLDFTRSPYVAAFFALSKARGDAAVWAVDTIQCHATARGHVERFNRTRPPDERPIRWPAPEGRRTYWEPVYVQSLFERDIVVIIPLEPFRKNERLNIQRGLFLIPGSLDQGFMAVVESFTGSELGGHVRKYVLKNEMRQKAIRDLNRMNISRASLFPGIDGYAASLRDYPLVLAEEEFNGGQLA